MRSNFNAVQSNNLEVLTVDEIKRLLGAAMSILERTGVV